MARPKLVGDQRQDQRVTTTVQAAVYDQLRRMAVKRGCSVSSVVRQILKDATTEEVCSR